ncbi:hypothetical protein LPW11_07905 [Geomonas sp. RF6]|uniref:tetratricopeptide repeat-containing protein n=1 Tax=Geomonas sp. RF6 TaxID=2897342 RepID=UPI001E2EFF3F|nr:tetratricopeptide repeat-containing protein [Geomonas sp. RF6]UFS72105.1 hypothetical protein LPW11_07905 [Geomonas sp. RF6]
MNPHVFVAMPFGKKEEIDFDAVYHDLIEPALKERGFEVFRADQELRAGEIRADMFQELLLADLVVADVSIDNPNVWYELGVRHALRSRGVILIQSKREYQPFDIYTDRKLTYHIKDGAPDPAALQKDRDDLARHAVETFNSWHGRKISPVYQLLPYLEEPEWKKLYVKESGEFWEQHEAWGSRIETARRNRRPADIMVLAEEAPNHALMREARLAAGKALINLGHFELGIEQLDKGIAASPEDAEMLRSKALALGRLKKHSEAKEILRSLLREDPSDAETLAHLGRVGKEAWVSGWRREGIAPAQMLVEAALEDGLLREAICTYSAAFLHDPCHYYSGINAITLSHLLAHVSGTEKPPEQCALMEGGVRWAIRSALSRETVQEKDYWARASLGDLELLASDTSVVERAYRDAVAVADGNWFDIDCSRQQLLLLKDLNFRAVQVEAALRIFEREMEKLVEPWRPQKVFLFSGHMIDAPGRAEPRFPPEKEEVARGAIAAELDRLGAMASDLAICGGACGGDILFAEEALKRGLRVNVRIPFPKGEFLERSVAFAGEQWVDRFQALKEHKKSKLLVLPEELGPTPVGANPYERNNLWQLYYALSWGPEKVQLIALWDGKAGDGRGGTKHMCDSVRKRSGDVHVIETRSLW